MKNSVSPKTIADFPGDLYKVNHGCTDTPTYKCWADMKTRCFNPKFKKYKDWGGRGITVCEEWRYSFSKFLSDMGHKPIDRQLDRIDNDGPYCKANCRWATVSEQLRNRRTNRTCTINGETLCLAEWCERYKISRGTIQYRLQFRGWSLGKAITTPVERSLRRPA